jgi:hypothetical protein
MIADCATYMRKAVAIGALLCCPQPGYATLYVIVMDRRGISIAADSRRIVVENAAARTVDGVEKVIRLGPKVAFMSSGVTDISVATARVRPALIARHLYADFSRAHHGGSLHDLSLIYAKATTKQLNALTRDERSAIASLADEVSNSSAQLLESIIAGVDGDGNLKVETIDVYVSARETDGVTFGWNAKESVAAEMLRVIFSGEVSALRSAFEDASAPLSRLPSFQSWAEAMQDGKPVDLTRTAEALLNLAIEYSPPKQTRLGYPIFVYGLTPGAGLRRVRVVSRGNAMDLPH